MKPTSTQLAHLKRVAQGKLTRSGSHYWFYHMGEYKITGPMVDRLESNGWIEWPGGSTARLTDAGRMLISGKVAGPK